MKEQFYFAEKSQLLTQAQLLAFEHAKSSLKIGIPKETTMQENRVALVPHSVINLTARGHEIVIESEAGLKSNYSDHEYSEAGAQIVHDKKSVFECDIISPKSNINLSITTADYYIGLYPNASTATRHLPCNGVYAS